MRTLERILLVLAALGIMVPLVYWTGPIGIPTWSLPIAALLFVQLAKAASRQNLRFRRLDAFEVAVIVFVTAMTASTLVTPTEDPLHVNKLFVYVLALGLAVYAKRNFGSIITTRRLVLFAYLFITVQFCVSLAQYITNNPVGNLGAYLGQSETDRVGGGYVRKALGVSRVFGTLGGSANVLGNSVVALLPFVAVSRSVFSQTKDNSFHYLGQRAVVSMAVITVAITISRASILVLCLYAAVFGVWRLWQSLKLSSEPLRFDQRHLWGQILTLSLGGILMVTVFTNSTLQRTVGTGIDAVQWRASQIGSSGGIGPVEKRYLRIVGAVELFGEGPMVLGGGYLSTSGIAAKADVPVGGSTPEARVHNAHAQYLAEGGIFAFIAFAFITLYPLYVNTLARSKKNAINYAFAASVGAIVLFMQSTTAHNSTGLGALYMIIFGCAVAYGKTSRH